MMSDAVSDNAAAAGDYEDDFELDDIEQRSTVSDEDDQGNTGVTGIDHDSSFETEYCDDFEEYSPEQELEDVRNCAKQLQEHVWNTVDDITIVDDGPVDIRQLLKPHCEALVGRDRFNALISTTTRDRADAYAIRSSGTNQMCHFIEELYGAADDDDDT